MDTYPATHGAIFRRPLSVLSTEAAPVLTPGDLWPPIHRHARIPPIPYPPGEQGLRPLIMDYGDPDHCSAAFCSPRNLPIACWSCRGLEEAAVKRTDGSGKCLGDAGAGTCDPTPIPGTELSFRHQNTYLPFSRCFRSTRVVPSFTPSRPASPSTLPPSSSFPSGGGSYATASRTL